MKINKIYCNKCGKEFDMYDLNQGFNIHRRLGYGSSYDGRVINLDLCCKCMDEFISNCEIAPFENHKETADNNAE